MSTSLNVTFTFELFDGGCVDSFTSQNFAFMFWLATRQNLEICLQEDFRVSLKNAMQE